MVGENVQIYSLHLTDQYICEILPLAWTDH